MKSFVRMFAVVSLGLALGIPAGFAEETAAAPAASPEQQAQMEKVKQNTTPGEAHKALEPLAGKWNYTSKFFMSPDGKPEESSGTSQAEVIYGGRFVKETIQGTWMGQPFEGTGYTGYDNVKQEYVTAWIDGMSTGIMTASGSYDAATKTLKTSGINSCPLTGKKDMAGRMELVITDNDHHTLSGFAPMGPQGEEIKTMEIAYTRAA